MDLFTKIVIIVGVIAAPSALWTAFARYSEWAANMRGNKAIQVVALVSVAAFIALDAVDRLGILWPSPSEVAASLKKAQDSQMQQAAIIDDLRTAQRRPGIVGSQFKFRAINGGKNGIGMSVQGNVDSSTIEAGPITGSVHIGAGAEQPAPAPPPPSTGTVGVIMMDNVQEGTVSNLNCVTPVGMPCVKAKDTDKMRVDRLNTIVIPTPK